MSHPFRPRRGSACLVLAAAGAGILGITGCGSGGSGSSTSGSPSASSATADGTPTSGSSSAALATPSAAPVVLAPTPNDPETGVNSTADTGICTWVPEDLLTEINNAKPPASTLGQFRRFSNTATGIECWTRLSGGSSVADPEAPGLVSVIRLLGSGSDSARTFAESRSFGKRKAAYTAVKGLGDNAVLVADKHILTKRYMQELVVADGKDMWQVTVDTGTDGGSGEGSSTKLKTDRSAILKKIHAAVADAATQPADATAAREAVPAETLTIDNPETGIAGSATLGYCRWLDPSQVADLAGAKGANAYGVFTRYDDSRSCTVTVDETDVMTAYRTNLDAAALKTERDRAIKDGKPIDDIDDGYLGQHFDWYPRSQEIQSFTDDATLLLEVRGDALKDLKASDAKAKANVATRAAYDSLSDALM